MTRAFRIAGLGEILWDLLPDGRRLGGAPANTAWHARCLGADAAVASRVGDDDDGRDVLRRLEDSGIDRSAVGVDPDRPTGTVTVELDDSGTPAYVIHEDVAWDHIEFDDDDLALAGSLDAVCFGTLARRAPDSRSGIAAFLDAVPAGALRLCDVNLRQDFYDASILDACLRDAGVCKLNDEELPIVAASLGVDASGAEAEEALVERYDLRALAVTRGGRGSRIRRGDETSDLPGTVPERMVDSVGAGDAFAAALTVGLLAGRDLARIHEAADRLAAFVCSQPGATPTPPHDVVALVGIV